MFTWIQRHLQWLLITALVIIFLAFGVFGVPWEPGRTQATNRVEVKVDGKSLRTEDLLNLERFFDLGFTLVPPRQQVSGFIPNRQLAREIQEYLISLLSVPPQGQPDLAQRTFALNLYLLRKETERLGLKPTIGQIQEVYRQLFFDPATGQSFPAARSNLENSLPQLGMSIRDFEDFLRDFLSFRMLNQQWKAGAVVVDEQVTDIYFSAQQRVSVKTLTVKREDFEDDVQMTEEQINRFYEENLETQFMTDRRYKLIYLVFDLKPDEDAPAPVEDTSEETETTAVTRTEAEDFVLGLYDGSLTMKQLAEQESLELQQTEFFIIEEMPEPIVFATEAATLLPRLNLDGSQFSDPLKTTDGRVILAELVESREPGPKELDEVRQEVEEQLREKLATEMALEKAEEISEALNEKLAGKEDPRLEPVVEELDYQPEIEWLPAFAPLPQQMTGVDPALRGVLPELVNSTRVHRVSEPAPLAQGDALMVYIERRAPAEEQDIASFLRASAESSVVNQFFYHWMREVREDADLRFPGGHVY